MENALNKVEFYNRNNNNGALDGGVPMSHVDSKKE